MNISTNEIDFYPSTHLNIVKQIRAHIGLIQKEVRSIPSWFEWASDYVSEDGTCGFLNGQWTICPIFNSKYSTLHCPVPNSKFAELFPITYKLVTQIPLLKQACFSRLHPKTKLHTHTHENTTSDIMHIGVIVPQDQSCGLTVGNHTHIWNKAGDVVIFNDTRPHHAWNDSCLDRVVLYLSILDPKKMDK